MNYIKTALLNTFCLLAFIGQCAADNSPSNPQVNCGAQRNALSTAYRTERQAQVNHDRAIRFVESLIRRRDQDQDRVEREVASCEIKRVQEAEKLSRRTEALVQKALDLTANAIELETRALLCIGGFFRDNRRQCRRDQLISLAIRLRGQAARIGSRIELERRTADKKLERFTRQCNIRAASIQRALERSVRRAEDAQRQLTQYQEALANATFARQAAEQAYQACLSSQGQQ